MYTVVSTADLDLLFAAFGLLCFAPYTGVNPYLALNSAFALS